MKLLFASLLIVSNISLYCQSSTGNQGFSQVKTGKNEPLALEKLSIPAISGKAILSNPYFRKGLNESRNTVYFIPNEGQYVQDVLYSFNTREAQMLVFKDRLRLIALHAAPPQDIRDRKKDPGTEQHSIDIKFKGANELVPTQLVNKQSPVFNYFSGSTNATNIKAASEIHFNNIYTGITLRLYSNAAGSLEFDWIVNKPADYKKIKMEFNGQDFLHINKKGSLELGLRFGSLKLEIPETYQLTKNGKRIPFKNKFVLKEKNTAVYAVSGKPDAALPLIIDPVMIWGSFMDGNNANFDAYLFGGAKDANGDLYVCGGSQRITNTDIQTVGYGSPVAGFISTAPSGAGTGATGAGGQGVDWLIMKIKKDGSAVLTYTFFGLASTNTATSEQAHCISISPDGGSIFVGGYCNSNTAGGFSLPALSAAYSANTAFGGTTTTVDSVPTIAVFTADLTSLKYRTFIGNGSIAGDISSIEALNDNDFIVASWVGASLGNGAGAVPYVSGPDITHAGGYDVYLAKFSNFNNRVWGTYVGGNGNDKVFDMRLTSTGDIAFCGAFASTVATTTPLVNEVASTTNRNANGTVTDAMVGVLKADGSAFNMLSMVGGSAADQFAGLEAGNCDTLYLVGTISSNNFPNIGGGVIQTTYGGGTGTASDMILFKCPASGGNNGIGCYYGGGGNNIQDIGNSIAYLPVGTGKIFVFGSTQSVTMPVANNIAGNTFYNTVFQGGIPSWDMFFLECSPDFKTRYLATYVGGTGGDYLGNTGVQITGKQMLLLSDTSIGIFTTSHSANGTFLPNVISASGVFDNVKSNGTNDSWIMIKLDTKDLEGDIDDGDAPTAYGKASVQIATSGVNTAISLGNRVDADIYYPVAPGTLAVFDNDEGNSNPRKPTTAMYYDIGAAGPATANDEDALATVLPVYTFNPTYSVTVPYYNNSGQTCTIYGFIDMNIDGDFNDANEMVSLSGLASNANAAGSAGRTATLTWTLPGGVVLGNSYLRLIIVQGTGTPALTGCPGGVGYIKNQALGIGEVEDYPVVISASILPLSLIQFNGVKQNNFSVLGWQTANEQNIDYFELQRNSTNGIDFLPVNRIPGINGNATTNTYTYSDDLSGITSPVVYYRLKIVDRGGHFKYSPVVVIKINGKDIFRVAALPNPFGQQLNISIESPVNQQAQISLADMSGKIVLKTDKVLKKGITVFTLHEVASIAKGIYFLTVAGDTEKQTLKLVKEK
jgi:hypothetical protein